MDSSREKILVFASNTLGDHDGMIGNHAKQAYGAMRGCLGAINSSYSIPTVDIKGTALSESAIYRAVDNFILYAARNQDCLFMVTKLKTDTRDSHLDFAPMFINSPDNIVFPYAWKSTLGEDRKYWSG